MRGVKPVVILCALVLPEMTFADDNGMGSPVSFELTREGDSVSVLIRPIGEDVFLPACRGVVWERFVQPDDGGEGRYETLPDAACGPSKPPIKVSKDGVRFTSPALEGAETVVLRTVAVVGLECSEVLPMPIGGCREVSSQVSTNITITPDSEG